MYSDTNPTVTQKATEPDKSYFNKVKGLNSQNHYTTPKKAYQEESS